MNAKKNDLVVVNTTPMEVITAAVANGGDISILTKLMELQERYEDREAKKAFDKALADFKAEPLTIKKDAHVKYNKVDYKHATLANIISVVTPELSKAGLSLSWRTGIEGNFIKVTAVLSHSMGHSEETWLTATGDSTGSKNALQAVGSTISYLQRYTAMAILGITSGDIDDDGNRGGDIKPPVGSGYEERLEEREEDSYFSRCMAYVDSFAEKSLDEFLAMKDAKIEEAYKSLSNDAERQKLKSLVNSVEQLLLEQAGGMK